MQTYCHFQELPNYNGGLSSMHEEGGHLVLFPDHRWCTQPLHPSSWPHSQASFKGPGNEGSFLLLSFRRLIESVGTGLDVILYLKISRLFNIHSKTHTYCHYCRHSICTDTAISANRILRNFRTFTLLQYKSLLKHAIKFCEMLHQTCKQYNNTNKLIN